MYETAPFSIHLTTGTLLMKIRLVFLFFLFTHLTTYGQELVRTFYDEEKRIVREVYRKVNGVAEGEYKLFYEEGSLAVLGQLSNDKKEGLFIDFFPNTQDTLRIIHYENNLKQGPSRNYYQSGEISQELHYVDDQLEGEVISYFESGITRQKATFKK